MRMELKMSAASVELMVQSISLFQGEPELTPIHGQDPTVSHLHLKIFQD